MAFDPLSLLSRGTVTFRSQIILRVAGLFATLLALAVLTATTQSYAAMVLCSALVLIQVYVLIRFVERSNRDVARFISAIRHDDFAQGCDMGRLGGSFADLQCAMAAALDNLRATRAEGEAERATLRVLIEHAPVALLAIDTDGSVELVNTAARRLLDRGRIDSVANLSVYGEDFSGAMEGLEAGRTQVIRMKLGPSTQRVKLSVTELTMHGRRRRLMSIENIQSELDATELKAWHNLVRVLTHEMMNSMTPVSSLAGTARQMLEDLNDRIDADVKADMADIRDALDTIARRSEGLLRFVEHYRQLTRIPVPNKGPIKVAELLDRLGQLMAAEADRRRVALTIHVEPPHLVLNADVELVEQALINVLRNAFDALDTVPAGEGRIEVEAQLEQNGDVGIRVSDNGPGLPSDVADKIFVPFFTTKKSGSGVGLSLVRQVMSAHEGSVAALSKDKGVVFALRFP